MVRLKNKSDVSAKKGKLPEHVAQTLLSVVDTQRLREHRQECPCYGFALTSISE